MRRRKAAIFINGRQHSLKGVTQYGITISPPLPFFSATHKKCTPQIQTPRQPGQARGAHKLRTQTRQFPLTQLCEALEEFLGNGQLKDGITQELQTLIMPVLRSPLVSP